MECFLLLLPLLLYKSFLTLGHVTSMNRIRKDINIRVLTANSSGYGGSFFKTLRSISRVSSQQQIEIFFECVQHIHEIQINHLVNDLDLKLELFKKDRNFQDGLKPTISIRSRETTFVPANSPLFSKLVAIFWFCLKNDSKFQKRTPNPWHMI